MRHQSHQKHVGLAPLLLLGALLLGCADHRSARDASTTVVAAPKAGRTPAYAGSHPDITGHWLVTSFVEQKGDVYTCLDDDATIEFRRDGSWQALTRMSPHSYGGTFVFTAADRLTLVTGVTQYYRVTVDGDAMTWESGASLHASLRRIAGTP